MGVIVKNNNNSDSRYRSESVDSLSSTVDVHDDASKKFADADHNHAAPTEEERDLDRRHDSLSSSVILSLDSASHPKVSSLLDDYDGHLIDIGHDLLEGLRLAAPSSLAARVGDFNGNLSYEMRDRDMDLAAIVRNGGGCHGDDIIHHLERDIESFELFIRQSLRVKEKEVSLSYRGSFMRTERTMYQPAHVDYDYKILQDHGRRLFLAFFPLTQEGAFLQLWQDPAKKEEKAHPVHDADCDNQRKSKTKTIVEGTVVHIPYGKMLMVPSDTIHGGGFRRGPRGNLRFHLYIALEEEEEEKGGGGKEEEGEQQREREKMKGIELLTRPVNKYTERHDRRRELCERFVDAHGLDGLLGTFFDA